MSQDETSSEIPKQIDKPCHACGTARELPNGVYYRAMRLESGMTLKDMASKIGCNLGYLGRMELNDVPFHPKYADAYERICGRIRRAGEDY